MRHFINRNWEVLMLCFVLALQVLSGDLFLFASKNTTPYVLLNNAIAILAYLRQHIVPLVLPILVGAAFACFFLPLSPRRRRLFIDVMVGLVIFRLLMLFGILNVMIFLPLLIAFYSFLNFCFSCLAFFLFGVGYIGALIPIRLRLAEVGFLPLAHLRMRYLHHMTILLRLSPHF